MKKSVRLFFILSLLFIVLSSSFILAGQLKVTEEHPFLVNGEWISASELQIGDELTTIDGQKIVIKNLSVVNSEEEFSVYNLEAEDIHNFVVTEDNLVVHNSDALANGRLKNPLTEDELATLLKKPGGSEVIARQQAKDALKKINPLKKTTRENLIEAVKSHKKSSLLSASERTKTEVEMYDAVLENLIYNRDVPLATRTAFDFKGRFAEARALIDKNFFGPGDFGGKTIVSTYLIESSGIKVPMQVRYQLFKHPNGIIEFYAHGGVYNGARISPNKLMDLLDSFKLKAISPVSVAEKAEAIAEFEWIHSVTTPSGYGGGTVLMQQDYRLLEAAGFKIPSLDYRRVELEAIGTPHDEFIAKRVQELTTWFLN